MAGDFAPTTFDYELAEEISALMRNEHGDFRTTSRAVLNAHRVSAEEWRERLANIGHILGKRQKPKTGKIADEVSGLIHRGYTFEEALRRALSEYGLEGRYGSYAHRVGVELAQRKRVIEERKAREALRARRRAERQELAAVRARRRLAKSRGRGKAVQLLPLLPQVVPGMSPDECAHAKYQRRRMLGEALFLSHLRHDELLDD